MEAETEPGRASRGGVPEVLRPGAAAPNPPALHPPTRRISRHEFTDQVAQLMAELK